MAIKDLHILPRVEDGWSFLYVEHCRVEQDGKSIAIWEGSNVTPVPCAVLSLLILGPGTAITHAAVRTLAESGCLIQWSGEASVRVYGLGLGETRSSRNLLRQARAWADPKYRLQVVRRLYAKRFGHEQLEESMTLQKLRGREGIRVRQAYAEASRETGVEWKGRNYDRSNWRNADPVNRALSCANSCLYGICHAAIVAAGFSPAIGFIHSGKALSFVYDIADLYKLELSVPAAFAAVQAGNENLEGTVRRQMRDLFARERVLERIVPDVSGLFDGMFPEPEIEDDAELETDDGVPTGLWDPVDGRVSGGVNYGEGGDGSDAS